MTKHLLLLFIGISFQIHGQIIYVNQQASGSNDGSSWENAYTDLADGLADNSSDEVWVANGKYTRLAPEADSSASFVVNRSVTIRGGFEGFETDRAERNVVTASTIVTADIQDDDNGLDSLARLDNDIHAMYIFLGHKVTLDLLIFEGGQTLNDPDDYLSLRAGGGIYSESELTVSRCTFRSNYARSGGGLYIRNFGSASFGATNLENCLFENNKVTSQSAGVVFNNLPELTVSNCTFKDNETNRGVCYPLDCTKATISECRFENNVNPTGFGGALFSWQNNELIIDGCEFVNNTSTRAGACYIDGRELAINVKSVTITNCSFESNRSTLENGDGGALYFFRASFDIDNCAFNVNSSSDSAGAIYATGESKVFDITNCSFAGNSGVYGGAVSVFGDFTEGRFTDCSFIGNQADIGGGVMNIGFQAGVELVNCKLEENSASLGGAISIQNDTTSVSLINTTFTANSADNGGAIGTFNSSNNQFSAEGCRFERNIASNGAGVFLRNHDGNMQFPFTISNTIFSNNVGNIQGAGFNVVNASGILSNCLFQGNEAFATGTGGAMSLNADSMDIDIIVRHNTIVDNRGELSNGIALWGIGGTANCIMQNSILDNDGVRDYALEEGLARLISQGGNFVGDFNLVDSFDLEFDVFESDPGFVDRANGLFQLSSSSPCIDKGRPEWSSMNDISGYPRDDMPDIGCYEFGSVLSTDNTIIDNTITVYPNPATHYIQVDMEASHNTDIYLFDNSGKWMRNYQGVDTHGKMEVKDLPAGVYHLVIAGNSGIKRGKFIKG